MKRFWTLLGPSVSFMGWRELVRAVGGLFFGLGLVCVTLAFCVGQMGVAVWFAPTFAATAALIFAVPNNPLAQPWSVFVGYICALSAGLLVREHWGTATATDGLALQTAPIATLALMSVLRALHPPAIAFSAMIVGAPEVFAGRGWGLFLFPVGVSLLALTVSGALYAHATGRRYPARRTLDPNARDGTRFGPASGLSNAQLSQLLRDYSQSSNISVADLAQLMGAAGLLAAKADPHSSRCEDIMSRDLVTVAPDAQIDTIDDLFRQHAFISLPVTETDGTYLGMIFQLQLLNALDNRPTQRPSSLWHNLRIATQGPSQYRARDLMVTDVPALEADTPIDALLPVLAERHHYAVPILRAKRIVGVVTRSDLVSALALQCSHRKKDDL